jgi:hypothetical protein
MLFFSFFFKGPSTTNPLFFPFKLLFFVFKNKKHLFLLIIFKNMASLIKNASAFKLALVQLGNVGANKTHNLAHARDKILEAAKNGAQVVVLPVSSVLNC